MLTTLFLDFGDRFVNGILSMTEDQYVTDLGGVQIGSNSNDDTIDLTSFSGVAGGIDFNADNVDDAADLADMRAAIVELVELAFAPFDVQVVQLTGEFTDVNGTTVRGASSVAEAARNLTADTDKDAYVFVTGASVSPNTLAAEQLGIAPLDVGNMNDSTAFTVIENIIPFAGFRGKNIDTLLTNVIAQQTGLTFGLEYIDVDESLPDDQRRLATSEAMIADLLTPESEFAPFQHIEAPAIFSRFDMATRDSIISPTQNSYELMVENVGASSLAFVTGSGAYDRITISVVEAGKVDVLVEAFATPEFTGSPISSYSAGAVDVTGGLSVNGGNGDDLHLIDPAIATDVVVDGFSRSLDRLRIDANNATEINLELGAADSIWNESRETARSLLDLGNGTTFSAQGFTVFEVENAQTLNIDTTETSMQMGFHFDYFGDQYNVINSQLDLEVDSSGFNLAGAYSFLGFRNIENLNIVAGPSFDRVFSFEPFEAPGLKNVGIDLGETTNGEISQVLVVRHLLTPLPTPGGQYIVDGGSGSNLSVWAEGSEVAVNGHNSGSINDLIQFSGFKQINAGGNGEHIRFLPGGRIDGKLTSNSHTDSNVTLDLSALTSRQVTLIDNPDFFRRLPHIVIDGLFEFAENIGSLIGTNAFFSDQLTNQMSVAPEWKINDGLSELTYPANDPFATSFFFSGFEIVNGTDQTDIFTIETTETGSGVHLNGGGGDDRFDILQTGDSFVLRGADGQDEFNIGNNVTGRLTIDGGNDNDIFDFQFTNEGAREIGIFDTGISDSDTLNVRGTLGDDVINMSSADGIPAIAMGSQQIDTIDVENLVMKTLKGDDIVNFDGNPATFVDLNTNTGNDRLFITGTEFIETLNVATGAGRDRLVVRQTDPGTIVNLNTNNDDDFIFVGSTAHQNDGDLNNIRGRLHIKGGINSAGGEDRLYVNDHGTTGDFDYRIHPTWIVNLPYVSSPQRSFAGINYDSSIEVLRLESTDGENHFEVIASFHTRYVLDGNLPMTNPGDVVELIEFGGSGSQLSTSGNGSYTWTFSNGMQLIQLFEIESTFANDGSNGSRTQIVQSNFQPSIHRSDFESEQDHSDAREGNEHDFLDSAFSSLENEIFNQS